MTERVALTGVRVFDGRALGDPATVVIDGDRLGTDAAGARTVDGAGGALLPGLVDAHVHLSDRDHLTTLAGYGVTTALDLGCWPPDLVASLRAATGTTDARFAGVPAIAPDGPHLQVPGFDTGLVRGPDDAAAYVAARVREGADHLKIIVEKPGPGAHRPETVAALARAARDAGLVSVAHAVEGAAVATAQAGDVDVVTHSPLDTPLDATAVDRMRAGGRAAVPTLAMMEAVAGLGAQSPYGGDLGAALASVAALHAAGVPVVAGTDANALDNAPDVPHGDALHHELELLVAAGLAPVDALRAATVVAAEVFRLADRGAVRPGLRADLVLLEPGADPLADITATRAIRQVWCAGVPQLPS